MILINVIRRRLSSTRSARCQRSAWWATYDPIEPRPYSRDPRYAARKALDYLRTRVSPTPPISGGSRVFVFDKVDVLGRRILPAYRVDSIEGPWNTGIFGWALRCRTNCGYFQWRPLTRCRTLRSGNGAHADRTGVDVELHHHEVGNGRTMRDRHALRLHAQMAGQCRCVQITSSRTGPEARQDWTFMPNRSDADNGSGMHTHQSPCGKTMKPLFFDEDGYAGLNQLAKWVHWRHSEAH